MADVREHVEGYLGETYLKLTTVALYDGQTRPDVVGMKIDAALSRFEVTEAGLNEFGRMYVAAWATRTLIPLAIDYYMVLTRLVDNASRPPGVAPLGGEVGLNYNRVAALQKLDEQLATFLAEEEEAFQQSNGATLGHGILVSQHTRTLRTQDPYDAFDKPGGRRCGPVGYDIGNVYVIVQEEVSVG